MFALIVFSKEVLCYGDQIMTPAGSKFWVCEESEGWVEAEATKVVDERNIPEDIKIFKTVDSALKFAREWDGFPWWCKPDGRGQVIPIKPKYKKVLTGYEIDKEYADGKQSD